MGHEEKITEEEKAKAFVCGFNNLLFDMGINYFLTALQQQEENDNCCFFDTIIMLEEIGYGNIS